MEEVVHHKPAGSPRKWRLRDTLWQDRFGAGYAVGAPGALLLSLVRELGYNRFVDICFYTGRSWKRALERLVIDFSAVKWADTEGIRYLLSQLHNDVERRGGDVFLVRPPEEAKRFAERLWGGTRIQFAERLSDAIDRQADPEDDESPGAGEARGPAAGGRSASGDPDGGSFREALVDFPLRLQIRDVIRRGDQDRGGSGPGLLDMMP